MVNSQIKCPKHPDSSEYHHKWYRETFIKWDRRVAVIQYIIGLIIGLIGIAIGIVAIWKW